MAPGNHVKPVSAPLTAIPHSLMPCGQRLQRDQRNVLSMRCQLHVSRGRYQRRALHHVRRGICCKRSPHVVRPGSVPSRHRLQQRHQRVRRLHWKHNEPRRQPCSVRVPRVRPGHDSKRKPHRVHPARCGRPCALVDAAAAQRPARVTATPCNDGGNCPQKRQSSNTPYLTFAPSSQFPRAARRGPSSMALRAESVQATRQAPVDR